MQNYPACKGNTVVPYASVVRKKFSQVDFPNKYVLQSLNIAFIIANSADPGEMQHYQTTVLLWGFQHTKGLFPIIR